MSERSAGDATASGSHPPTERLRAYIDDRLPVDEAEEVAGHLDVCERCVGELDELERPPVRLPVPADAPDWDTRRMRRSVRLTVLRTAINAVLLLLVGWLVLTLVGALVIHPLLVDRGQRLPNHVAATIDVPVMTIPGAELRQVMSNPGIVRRATEAEFERAIGAHMAGLGTFATRLGPVGMSVPSGTGVGPGGPRLEDGSDEVDTGPIPFEPDRLGEGTAVTVELTWYDDPIDLGMADAVADPAGDVALLWVGFRIPGGDEPQDPSWVLGYSACGRIPEFALEQRSGGFGGGGFRTFLADGGAQHALDELRRATANLATLGWPDTDTAPHGALSDPARTAEVLAGGEPQVATVVITGPTQAVADAVAEQEPDTTSLLGVDFDRGAPAMCG